nr:MAG TPA: hypothetical protein [Caudoviricetes sp.]
MMLFDLQCGQRILMFFYYLRSSNIVRAKRNAKAKMSFCPEIHLCSKKNGIFCKTHFTYHRYVIYCMPEKVL